jgi:transcriptional regulator
MEINTIIPPEIQQIKQRFSIIGNAASLINAISRALQVAPIDLSVLITGESGSGKEFFPKIIHAYSARKHSKYIAVNCGAIPEGTIDSELFGHEKGAFTGAISSRKGYFEEADGGTIFLDEVAELPLTTQARLLRVLESGEFIKVGSSTVQKTNIRVVAATNMDMLKAVSDGKFREDLYYRLSTVHIEVPPLRDRGNDILLLTRKFTNDFAEKYRTPAIEFSNAAKEILLEYRWPGNVRQLKNIIEQVALFEAGKSIDEEKIKSYLPQYGTEYKPVITSIPAYNYAQEREMLFQTIFRMRKEIDELRSAIENIPQTIQTGLAQDIDELPSPHTTSHSLVKYPCFEAETIKSRDDDDSAYTKEIDVSLPEEGHTMTLEDTERETIRKSLERNCGKRKKTLKN